MKHKILWQLNFKNGNSHVGKIKGTTDLQQNLN